MQPSLWQPSVELSVQKELHIDRAYLSSHLVRKRGDDPEVYCKAWPVRAQESFRSAPLCGRPQFACPSPFSTKRY